MLRLVVYDIIKMAQTPKHIPTTFNNMHIRPTNNNHLSSTNNHSYIQFHIQTCLNTMLLMVPHVRNLAPEPDISDVGHFEKINDEVWRVLFVL